MAAKFDVNMDFDAEDMSDDEEELNKKFEAIMSKNMRFHHK